MTERPSSHSRRRVGFYALVSLLALNLSGPPLRGGAAKASPDVAMTDDQVFVADPGRGAVLQGSIQPGRLPFVQLAPMPSLTEVKQPVAIDVRGSRLVVLDGYGPAVYDVDLRANTVKTLVRGAPLREPTGIAIAASGTVAVTDPSNRALFLFAEGKEVQIDRRFSIPLQVEFDPSENALYVYDAERGLLRVEYSGVDDFIRMRNSERITTPLTGITRVLSFAPRRGLVYLAEESGLRVAIIAKRSSLIVPQQYYRRRFASIALHPQLLAGIDDARTAVDIVDRPLPVSVTLDPEEGDPNAGMLALLDYLSAKRLLAARGVEPDPPNEPYERTLVRYNVLPPAWTAGKPPDPSRVKSVFCALNPRRCGTGGAAESEEIAIPQLTLESFVAVTKRPLEGKSIEKHIDEKVDPSQRESVKTDYLSKFNPYADGTLESELVRRKLVMAVPMSGALTPGAIIRVAGITDTPSGDLASRCGVPVERETSATFLPETIATRVLAALPDAVRAEAAAAAAAEVELGFDRVVREAILPPSRECRPKDSGQREYIVTELVRVDGLRYRIRSAPARGRDGMASQTARPPVWKVIPGTFVVAYKAVELSSAAFGLAERAVDPARIKPDLIDGKAILARSEGEANLPMTHWRFDVLVPATEILTGASPLVDLRKTYRTLGLSSHERVLTSARSVLLRPVAGPLEDVKVTLMQARKNLSKTIAYFDDLARGTGDVYVAVGEADDEVHQDHPGFVHNTLSAWFESTMNGLTRRRPPAAAASAAAELHQLSRADHGTHVSGIIGARSSSLMPGLTPEVRLFLVDTARNLTDAIQDAYDADLRLFNFSFDIKPDPGAEAAMKTRMLEHWTDALFVVAAGNEGLNLNSGGSQPLVSWVLEAHNIIGVGASRADGLELMGPQPDPLEPGKTVPGSNFGSRFVQLIAPGEQIHSLGDRQYAFATGTSQAVPQVTAAAAILSLRTSGARPLKIKARLIATANWNASFKDKVWGGLLDVDRAVEHLQRNVVRLQSAPASVRAITLGDDVKLKIRQATTYPSDGTPGTFVNVQEVLVRKILRLQHLGASQFRIVMIDPLDRLTIMFGRVEGKIACTLMEQYDAAAGQFAPLAAGTPNPCAGDGIPTQQLQDYVARAAAIPEKVKF